jgi:UDP:flavonoid glycosyltransferase YjiC (YdhE family)
VSQVLQALWAGGGNVAPQLAIARALADRGHEVRVLAGRSLRDQVERAGAGFVPYERAPDVDASDPQRDPIRDWEARTPFGAFGRWRDGLICGPAAGFAADVHAELDARPADVVVFDYMLLGACVGAQAAALPSVALVHTPYPLPAPGAPPFGLGLSPMRGPLGALRDASLRRLTMALWRPGLPALNEARAEFGLPPLDHPFEQILLAERVLILTSPELDFASRGNLPPIVRYAGPVLSRDGADGWESPWAGDDPRPLVLASFSSTFQDQGGLADRVIAALGSLPVRGLLTKGPALDVGEEPTPENVFVRSWVPHAAVLPDADLVITHGGLGTIHAALSGGVPLVCMPHGRDQDDNAARVATAGAGVRVSRGASQHRIRAAVEAAVADESLRAEARRLANAFSRQDGATNAVAEIEALVRT